MNIFNMYFQIVTCWKGKTTLITSMTFYQMSPSYMPIQVTLPGEGRFTIITDVILQFFMNFFYMLFEIGNNPGTRGISTMVALVFSISYSFLHYEINLALRRPNTNWYLVSFLGNNYIRQLMFRLSEIYKHMFVTHRAGKWLVCSLAQQLGWNC